VATMTRTAFSADMAILDAMELDQTFASAAKEILRYWRQERSKKPLMEMLFQGRARLGERISLSIAKA
ncbi:hypothetical protein, partial [Massilia sp. YIM B02443]|uniref:hypothetical protein n=1 Tax=Massilia sp. YIM B02443 TaxID=3050127 RepID=UPI0025B6F8A6